MTIPHEMRELMNEMEDLLAAHYTETCDYDYVSLQRKAHRYMDTLSGELKEYFEEEGPIELFDMLCERILEEHAASGKPLKPEKKMPMPAKMRAMCREYRQLRSDDAYLEFEKRMLEYCETLTPEEHEILMADGIMDMLGMVCDGIRYKRDPHYYEKLVEAGILVEATE